MSLKGQTCSQFATSPNNKSSKTRVILETHSFLFLIENDLFLQKKSYCCIKIVTIIGTRYLTQYNFTFFASIFFNQKQHKWHFNFTSLKGQTCFQFATSPNKSNVRDFISSLEKVLLLKKIATNIKYSLIGPNIILTFLEGIFFDQKHK